MRLREYTSLHMRFHQVVNGHYVRGGGHVDGVLLRGEAHAAGGVDGHRK
jgi:hypothetical protein